jgi:hypothetical protein
LEYKPFNGRWTVKMSGFSGVGECSQHKTTLLPAAEHGAVGKMQDDSVHEIRQLGSDKKTPVRLHGPVFWE